MDVKLYVGNVPYTATENELWTLFEGAGTVVSVNLVTDRYTGKSRGFAFVEMSTQAEAEEAIKMFNDYSMSGRSLKVNIARPREERGGGFDRRGGGQRNDRKGGRDSKRRRY